MEAIHAGRDVNISHSEVNINQQTEQPKLLGLCSNAELINERTHRKGFLRNERAGKEKLATPLTWVGITCLVLTTLLSFLFEPMTYPLITGFTALGAFGSLAAMGKVHSNKSEFEIRQEQALKEIAFILKERGVE